MNLYDLLEKYTWEGVKAYHFQFHRKRVASGKSIYHPIEWRQLDSELIASKCFAYPALRATWVQGQKILPGPSRRIQELPICKNTFTPTTLFTPAERRITNNQTTIAATSSPLPAYGALTMPSCRNWNFRECRSTQCRYQHSCLTCGSNHKATRCTSAASGLAHQTRNPPYGRQVSCLSPPTSHNSYLAQFIVPPSLNSQLQS